MDKALKWFYLTRETISKVHIQKKKLKLQLVSTVKVKQKKVNKLSV